jgi:glutathione-regulated potassium-efflux system ancillary protein KefC
VGAATIAAAIVAVIVIGRYATRPALRAIARTRLRDVFTAFALLLVVGIAQVMQLAGVSMAFGAFLAGVLLASSEYRHALETDIEPFKGLLLGLFFIAVGMSVDLGLFVRSPMLVLGIAAAIVLAKALLLYPIAQRFGFCGRSDAMLIAIALSQVGEFAFVLFGAAGAVRVLPDDWGAAHARRRAVDGGDAARRLVADAICRRMGAGTSGRTTPSRARTRHRPRGLRRFGQIVGRLLFASGLRATVLDHDPDNIEILRRLGFRVFYGDATRRDLLETAGAASARVLVNAIDDVEASLTFVRVARRHFPHVPIVARARNVAHWHELKLLGVEVIERETFEAAIRSGRRALEALGVRPHEARERADRFRRHNYAMLDELHPVWADEEQRTAAARAARDELEQQVQRDVEALERESAGDWASAPLKTADRNS